MIRMMVFLGNPGLQYKNTRHNAAWLCSDYMDELKNGHWQNKFKGSWLSCGSEDRKVIYLKPETYMNKSGESVGAAASFFKIKPEEILVVHDDLELPFGEIGFRTGGGLAGHNGLKSISSHLGTRDFHRFRIGIGRPVHGSISSWVTGRFSGEEEIHLSLILEKSADMLLSYPGKEINKVVQSKIKVIN
ncbi:aminoacyl-tRNA hydrolase [Spirochaeta isovalerica]|uniref:Peptidyl-tRNA hydrolase n=1 Tax=Spirochaeta isovalerica TaxID=150 RepID=A0A841R5U1_9SPIO|nr:aminoacyl-tRNA hydrolase [Spirochaeta isovalerica]MBB6478389.1 PTH1 family peptidyl-tRNA hydrolase [Spirochaeta isovalerica]